MKPDITIADLLKQAEAHARAILIGSDREDMTPIAHLIRSDGDSMVIGCPWRDEYEKQITLEMLAAMMREGHVIRYMVMCEAWMRMATEEEVANFKPGDEMPRLGPLRDHPDRVEIVVASAVERGGKTTRLWQTKRDKRGFVTDLVEVTKPANFVGPWLDLLPMDA